VSRPNVTHPDISQVLDRGDDPLPVLLDIIRELESDVGELIPKYGTYEPGDRLEVVRAHLTLAIAAFKP